MKKLTQARLRELLQYDQETGLFGWLQRPSNRIRKNRKAGHIDGRGYLGNYLLNSLPAKNQRCSAAWAALVEDI